MGRKAQPINLLLHKGNKSHLTKKEIENRTNAELSLFKSYAPNAQIKAPEWLSDIAKVEFKRLAKGLKKLKILNAVNINSLAFYCDAFSNYLKNVKALNEPIQLVKGQREKLIRQNKQLFEQMFKIGIEFGFTPFSQAKLALSLPKKKEPSEIEKQFPGI